MGRQPKRRRADEGLPMDQIVLDDGDAAEDVPADKADILAEAPAPVAFASNWWRQVTFRGLTWYCFHSSQPDGWWALLLRKELTTAWLKALGVEGYSTWVATSDVCTFTRLGRFVPLPLMHELNVHKIVSLGKRPIAIRIEDLEFCLVLRVSKETFALWREAVRESLLNPELPPVCSVGPVGAFDAARDLDRDHFRGVGTTKHVLVPVKKVAVSLPAASANGTGTVPESAVADQPAGGRATKLTPIICSKCGKLFVSQANLVKHVAKCTEARRQTAEFQGHATQERIEWRLDRPLERTTMPRVVAQKAPLVQMRKEKGNWLRYPAGFFCYPCLVAGRKCVGRKYHAAGWKCVACIGCRSQGLTLRHCAVPRAYVKTRSGEWLQGDWAAISPQNTGSCHCCQRMGPIQGSTHCHSCSSWVCPSESCRKQAKVLPDLPIWFCCHCMGVPLLCGCAQSKKEVTQLLVNVELRRSLPPELCSSKELPKTADLNRKRRRCQTWWHGTNIELLPCSDPPIERRFLDDAAMLRKMQPLEYNALAESLTALRLRLPDDAEKRQEACFEWLSDQTFAEPSLIVSFLLKLHSEAEKDRYEGLRSTYKARRLVPSALEGYIAYWPNVWLADYSGSLWDLPIKASKEDSQLAVRANPQQRRQKARQKKKELKRQAKAQQAQRRKAFDLGIQRHLASVREPADVPLDDAPFEF